MRRRENRHAFGATERRAVDSRELNQLNNLKKWNSRHVNGETPTQPQSQLQRVFHIFYVRFVPSLSSSLPRRFLSFSSSAFSYAKLLALFLPSFGSGVFHAGFIFIHSKNGIDSIVVFEIRFSVQLFLLLNLAQ